MGVKGLLPLLKSIQKPCSLKQFAGSTLGVDAYGWLHRGTISCAMELAQGQPTNKFVEFAMSRVRMLQHFGIKPYLIFDGDYLPSKRETEKGRAARRKEAKAAGLELLRMGRTAQAYQELQKCIDVTPEMARQLMDELDKANVDFIVAPYEADPQLVYLEKQGVIHGIISEDSDMLVFGAKLLLTKLDQYGSCVSIARADFTACKEISLVGWSDDEFRWMCILSGCDYLAPIGNVGLKTAYRLLRKHKTVERTVQALRFDGKTKIAPDYLDAFKQAELTFQHQWVFCPEAKSLVHLNDLRPGLTAEQLPYIGAGVKAQVAEQVARGRLNPHTKTKLVATPTAGPPRARNLEKMQQTRTPLKKHQSIESFFKPKRTPLAELDPNLFTPSPSQQRLLEQQQQEWHADEVISRPSLFRATTDVSAPASAPPRRTLAELHTPLGHLSPKRQRLCSDSAIAMAMTGSAKATPAHSRFFSRPATFQSPSVNRARQTAQKKAEVSIWSDDSIEEAMSQLGETATKTTRPTKKLEVYRDEPNKESQSSHESQISVASLETAAFSQDGEVEPPSSPPTQAPALSDIRDGQEDISEEDWQAAAKQPLKPLPVAKELAAYRLDVSASSKFAADAEVPASDGEEEEDLLLRAAPTFGAGGLSKFVFTE